MVPGDVESLRSRSAVPLSLVGLGVAAGGVLHFAADDDSLLTDGGETLVLFFIAGAFVYAASRIGRADLSSGGVRRILLSTAGFGAVGFAIAGFLVVVRLAEGEPLGEEAYVLFLSTAGAGAVGPPVGYYYVQLGVSRDELEARYREVESLNKRLTVASRVLRHNLRNDLNVIDGAASTLSEEADIEEGEEWLELLDDRTDRLLSMCDQVSELQQVWRQDTRERIDLGETIERAVETVREAFPEADIELDVASDATVLAHPKLGAAIRETVHNAARHNDTEDVSIEVTVAPGDGPDDHVRVRVADDGTGIPEIEIEALTNPEETPLEHGSGVGLWLVHWVAEKSDARLDFREGDPSGTVVVFDLPRAEPPAETGSGGTTDDEPQVPEMFPT